VFETVDLVEQMFSTLRKDNSYKWIKIIKSVQKVENYFHHFKEDCVTMTEAYYVYIITHIIMYISV